MNLGGKAVLITGGRRVGIPLAHLLASRGAAVASRLEGLAKKPPAFWTCPRNRDCRSWPGTVGASRRVGPHGRADRGGDPAVGHGDDDVG